MGIMILSYYHVFSVTIELYNNYDRFTVGESKYSISRYYQDLKQDEKIVSVYLLNPVLFVCLCRSKLQGSK